MVFGSAVSVVAAVIVDRLNVAWFHMLPAAETVYIPSWQEVVITLNLVSFGVVFFGLAARYLPLFSYHHPGEPEAAVPPGEILSGCGGT